MRTGRRRGEEWRRMREEEEVEEEEFTYNHEMGGVGEKEEFIDKT
jgi:hypothetical protein